MRGNLRKTLRVRDIAVVCRSKNAGPFLLTLDVIFPDKETYEKVKRAHVLTPQTVARLYGVPESDVLFTEYDPAFAFKATISRLVSSGDIEDTDVYGAQQHAPLLDLEVPA